MVTPHSKLHFKVYNRYQLKQDVLMGTGKLDMFVLLRQHSGRCQFSSFCHFFCQFLVCSKGPLITVLSQALSLSGLRIRKWIEIISRFAA